MIIEYLIILAVIALLSVVQSIFGMGVLVFGTPTLLLLGYDFITTLGYLLPASFSISLLQVFMTKSHEIRSSRNLYMLCLPGIGFGLWVTEASPLGSWTNLMVGGILLVSAMVRLFPFSQKALVYMLEKYCLTYHLMMGVVHGLTNLGGAFLAILASVTSKDKEAIRYTIAYYYLFFSIVQMVFLAVVMGHHEILIVNLPVAILSGAIYLVIGNRIFIRTNNQYYNYALTLFIAGYGVVIVAKFFHEFLFSFMLQN
jgi:uncharacterized protein